MFEKKEPEEIFELCLSSWSEIVVDLSGEEVSSMRVGAVAENLGLYAPPVLDSISVSHVISLSSFEDFDKSAKIGRYTKLVTALVILNVWQDFKSWKSNGKPIDRASAWIPQRLLLGISGPQLKLPEWKKEVVNDIRSLPSELSNLMSSSYGFCEKHWAEIQSSLAASDLYHYSICSLADHLGLYWPRSGTDFRVVDLIDGFASPNAILKMRGVGKKKAETIFEVLSELWRFERGESDRLGGLLSDSKVDDGKVLSPMDLLELKWGYFCAAIRGSDLLLTSLDQHYRPLGMKCVPGIAVITLQEIISAESLKGFVSTRKGLGKKKLEDLSGVLCRIWATVEPEGPAGPPPPSPEDEAKAVIGELGEVNLEAKIAKVLEVAGVSQTTKGIIRKRYGFGGALPKILEALGQEMGVTRERIRQLQAAGERKVRDHAVSNAMIHRLEAEERLAMIEQLAAKCRSKLLREKRLRAIRSIPAHRFLIEVLYYGSVMDFLDGMVDLGLVQKVALGWWVGEKLEPGLLAKCNPVQEFLSERGLPCPIGLVASKFELDLKRAEYLLIVIGFRTRLGLVFEKKLSAIQRRSVFAVLVAILEERSVWNESTLYERAITYSRNKRLSFRLFQRDLSAIEGLIVNSAGPYAILNPLCFELFKTELAKDTMGESVGSVRDSQEPVEPETGITSDGLEACLWQIFRDERILKFEQVEERFLATGRTSLGSVGPIMLGHSDIIRYAPGWWGRYGLSLTSDDIDALCNSNDLQLYIEAKHGGGLLEMFGFWSPEMEYRWARWAENEADSDLFESLLAVITPDDWPVPEPIQNQWKRKQEEQGYYRLGSPTPDFSNGVSDFNSIYGLIALAVEGGELGYAGISHFLGWRFMNDRRAFSAIALLVVLGVLEARDEPDEPHRVTTDAENVLRRFSESLMEKPRGISTVWKDFVRSKLLDQNPREDFGWFSMEEFLSASSRWIDHPDGGEIEES
ncbi:MAG: hypothetical protein P1U58_17055 [Verrucomicrobiales bacterium]|nr:hypothetical protein [Verrucomicrobiales bacterium]